MDVYFNIEDIEQEALNRGVEVEKADRWIKLERYSFYPTDDSNVYKMDEKSLSMLYDELPRITHIPDARAIQDKYRDYDFDNATDESINADIKQLKSYCNEPEFLMCLILRLLDSPRLRNDGSLDGNIYHVMSKLIDNKGIIGVTVKKIYENISDQM